jgi:hypothetical protein
VVLNGPSPPHTELETKIVLAIVQQRNVHWNWTDTYTKSAGYTSSRFYSVQTSPEIQQ